MLRTFGFICAFFGLLAALAAAPIALGFQHHGEDGATPAASPGAMHGGGMSGTGAAYLVIRNYGTEADRLVGAETEVAGVVEIHEVADDGGVMAMRPLADGLEIPAGDEVILEPGGYHIMLIGLTQDLRDGDAYAMTLRFEQAGEVTITVPVRRRAELAADATPTPPTSAGDLTIAGAWSRAAPAFGAMGHAATPTP